jgi:outer membrane protein
MSLQKSSHVALCLFVAAWVVTQPLVLARDAQPVLSNPMPEPSTLSEVLSGNPIKLSVTAQAPSSDLPGISGPLSVKRAVDVGLQNNLVYKQTEIDTEMAKYRAKAALARFGPNISLNTFYATSSLDQMLFYPSDGTVAQAPMQPIQKGTLLSVLFSGTQPIFTGGFLRGNLKASRAQERESTAGYKAERIATALRIKEAYWNAVWNEAKLRVDSDYVKFRMQSADNIKERVEQGKTPRADYLREQAELATARSQLNQEYRDYNVALINLKAEMGVNLASLVDLADSLEYKSVPGDLSTYLIQAGLNRPEIAQTVNKIDEMQGKRMMARSAYSPHIDLYGLGSNQTGSSPDGHSEGRWGGFIGVLGHFTLFDSGQRINQLRESNAAIRQAQLGKQQAQLKVAQDVSTAWVDVDIAARNVELAKAEIASAEEDFRLLHARYLIGKAIQLEEFDGAIKLFRARLELQEAIYKHRLAQEKLIWASGDI